jgi:hypothetical protein
MDSKDLWTVEISSHSKADIYKDKKRHYYINSCEIQDFPTCIPVSSTNKTDRNDITEILLKVAVNTITLL